MEDRRGKCRDGRIGDGGEMVKGKLELGNGV